MINTTLHANGIEKLYTTYNVLQQKKDGGRHLQRTRERERQTRVQQSRPSPHLSQMMHTFK